MASPTVVINNSTGSDTQASGAGPSTAVFGTLAATHTNTTVNITDAVALGGVATDGSAVLWISSSSGRQWSGITAISGSSGAWVVTVATAYANTESGRTWAIGGKRATLAGSAQLGTDSLTNGAGAGGWTIDLQETGTDYTLSAEYVFSGNAVSPGTLLTSTSVARPVVSTSNNALNCMFNMGNCQHLTISNLNLKYTGAGGSVRGLLPRTSNGQYISLVNCILDGWYTAWDGQNSTFNSFANCTISQCEVKNCTNYGVLNQAQIVIDGCYVHGNTAGGVFITGANNPASMITNCVIDSNGTGNNLYFNLAICQGGSLAIVAHCTISNSPSGSGISLGVGGSLALVDSVIYGNATYGVDSGATMQLYIAETHCAYGANGSGARRSFSAGPGAVTLTSNPFTSGADFALNGTAGGGAACKSAGVYPPNATASTGPDIGAIPGGTFGLSAGSLLVNPGKTGGHR